MRRPTSAARFASARQHRPLEMRSQELLYGLSHPWPTFRAVNDTIRGGKSTSSLVVSPTSNLATFTGELDITALGGAGFASQSTTFDPTRLSLPRHSYSGLSLTIVLPHTLRDSRKEKCDPVQPHKFVVVLKNTKPATRPDGRRESVLSYEFEFDVDHLVEHEWFQDDKQRRVQVDAVWEQFVATYRGRPKQDAEPLDPASIYELSFMCRSSFGYQAGPFALDIVSVSAIRQQQRTSLERIWTRVMAWFSSLRSWVTGRSTADGTARLA
ncbi:uncharacterized protein JCM15063_001177 [Sporobolomyces koalae]|uniref:uncharacterized protein n=1 Tax=Sporobolomyces koalae TaxID=500713 RepID=UPI00318129BB